MTQLEILPPISGESPQKSALNELPFPISGLILSRFQVTGGGPLPAIILIMRLPAARSKVMLVYQNPPANTTASGTVFCILFPIPRYRYLPTSHHPHQTHSPWPAAGRSPLRHRQPFHLPITLCPPPGYLETRGGPAARPGGALLPRDRLHRVSTRQRKTEQLPRCPVCLCTHLALVKSLPSLLVAPAGWPPSSISPPACGRCSPRETSPCAP